MLIHSESESRVTMWIILCSSMLQVFLMLPNVIISLCPFRCRQPNQGHTLCEWQGNWLLFKWELLILNHCLLQKIYLAKCQFQLRSSWLLLPFISGRPRAWQRGLLCSYSGATWFIIIVPISNSSKREKLEFSDFIPSKANLLCGVNFMHKWVLK